MNEAMRNLLKQIPETFRRPGRLFRAGGTDQRRYLTRLLRRFYLQVFRRPEAPCWTRELEGGLSGRSFGTYEEYLELQRSKLEAINLTDYEVQFRQALTERLSTLLEGRRVGSALCLAARLGTEVRAFHDVGVFAVGIDLNPGTSNSLVLPGDFHHLAFGNHVVDLVYSNSFDHAFDLSRVLAEIKRVLRPGGLLYVDAQAGSEQAADDWTDPWAATRWGSVDDLAAIIVRQGFSLVERRPIEVPWNGDSLLFIAGEDKPS